MKNSVKTSIYVIVNIILFIALLLTLCVAIFLRPPELTDLPPRLTSEENAQTLNAVNHLFSAISTPAKRQASLTTIRLSADEVVAMTRTIEQAIALRRDKGSPRTRLSWDHHVLTIHIEIPVGRAVIPIKASFIPEINMQKAQLEVMSFSIGSLSLPQRMAQTGANELVECIEEMEEIRLISESINRMRWVDDTLELQISPKAIFAIISNLAQGGR